jgi:hypothetical protein
MAVCPETPIVMLLWLASLAVCFYGKAYVDTREEVKCQKGPMIKTEGKRNL